VNIEAQIIAKESYGLGASFFDACLRGIVNRVAHIIIVDNGCDEQARHVYQEAIPKEKLTTVEAAGDYTFSELRNLGIDKTRNDCEAIVHLDCDEVFCEQTFDEAVHALERFNTLYVPITHLTVAPCILDTQMARAFPVKGTTIFRKKVGDLHFKGDVHEGARLPGPVGALHTPFVHLGYIRPQWQIYLRILRYDLLQFGNLERDKQVWIKSPQSTPNTHYEGKDGLLEYYGPWYSFTPVAERYGTTKGNWFAYIESVEDYSFWEWWQQLAKEKGNWQDTLEIAVRKYYNL